MSEEQNDFLLELEKIANFSTDVVAPDDVANDPMVPDTAPQVDPATVEQVQATNAEVPPAADEQLPGNPEDDAALAEAIGQAQQQYEAAQQQLASAEEEWQQFEKTAQELDDNLPKMGALARLIHYSTDHTVGAPLQKLASERLIIAMQSEDGFVEMLSKTASELFETEENLEQLYSDEGRKYVIEHLASFVEDDQLEKVAFDLEGMISQAHELAKSYIKGTQNFWKLQGQIDAAKTAFDEAATIANQKSQAHLDAGNAYRELTQAGKTPNTTPDQINNLYQERENAEQAAFEAGRKHMELQQLRNRGGQVWGGGAALAAGGAYMGGKAIADHVNNHRDPEEQVTEKSASAKMNLGNKDIKGGNPEMTIVRDYLKIAGAAGLLEIANDENQEMALRKEAAETFNAIARMSRADMEASFEKMATTIYSEPQLHEIVGGNHNEYLFDKIAYFVEAHEMGADDLEKIAGADGVAAKGVGGALTDAKSNIEAKLEQDKVHTETVKNGEIGTRKPDDMRGYNVINNPSAYKVDKTAGISSLLEEAHLRKEAAYREFVEADTFIKLNSK